MSTHPRLKQAIIDVLKRAGSGELNLPEKPGVVLIVGVNGTPSSALLSLGQPVLEICAVPGALPCYVHPRLHSARSAASPNESRRRDVCPAHRR